MQPFSGAGEMHSVLRILALRELCALNLARSDSSKCSAVVVYTAMVRCRAWLRSCVMASAGFSPNSSSAGMSRLMLLLKHAFLPMKYGYLVVSLPITLWTKSMARHCEGPSAITISWIGRYAFWTVLTHSSSMSLRCIVTQCGFQSRNIHNWLSYEHYALCLLFESTTQTEMSSAKSRLQFLILTPFRTQKAQKVCFVSWHCKKNFCGSGAVYCSLTSYTYFGWLWSGVSVFLLSCLKALSIVRTCHSRSVWSQCWHTHHSVAGFCIVQRWFLTFHLLWKSANDYCCLSVILRQIRDAGYFGLLSFRVFARLALVPIFVVSSS